MRVSGKTLVAAVMGMLTLCVAVHAVAVEGGPPGTVPPADLVIKEVFAPGVGLPVGSVSDVEGTVILIHDRETIGYRAAKGHPLFKGDTIDTREGRKVRFILNDGSQITLLAGTILVITESIYAPAKNARSSFIDMGVGKARFLISKLVGLGSLNFKVKTQTAVCGVRGSDFIIVATPEMTEVTALKNTSLEVASLAYPGVKPVVLSDYQRVGVRKGELPSEVMTITPEEAEQMLEEFAFLPDEMGAEMPGVTMEEKVMVGETPPPAGILFSFNDLVPPELPGEAMGRTGFTLPYFMKNHLFREKLRFTLDQQDAILTDVMTSGVKRYILRQELPGMPSAPR